SLGIETISGCSRRNSVAKRRSNSAVRRIMNRCKKLHELPTVVTEWQHTAWYPDCEHYYLGGCDDPSRMTSGASCAFDGAELPHREMGIDLKGGMYKYCPQAALSPDVNCNTRLSELEEEIKIKILQKTRGRIQKVKVEAHDSAIMISGRAPCYYVKQL